MQGKVVIISAPSGSGKTTIVRHLLKCGFRLEFSVSATTRQKRENETDGKDYYFLSEAEFRRRIGTDEFVEWQEVYKGSFYGTLRSELERIWTGGNHVLFDVDVSGGINLKKIFRDDAVSIFIMPPSVEELEKRLISRGTDRHENIKIRLEKAAEEMKTAPEFDHIVINDTLQRAEHETFLIVSNFLKISAL